MMDSLRLSVDLRQRHQKSLEFDELFTQKVKSRIYRRGSPSSVPTFVENGFVLWKSVLESIYPNQRPSLSEWVAYKSSSIYSRGFGLLDLGLGKDFVDNVEDALSAWLRGRGGEKYVEQGNLSYSLAEIFEVESDLAFVLRSMRSLVEHWERIYLPEGLMLLPWRTHAYATMPDSSTESRKWHYDTNVTDDVVFFMFNLTDCFSHEGAGTYFVEAARSSLASMASDYISVPTSMRAESLDSFDDSIGDSSVGFIPARAGALVAFHPGRVLHKGSFGSGGRRDNLHLSASIVSEDTEIVGDFGGVFLSGKAKDVVNTCWECSVTQAANSINGVPYYFIS